MLLQEDFRALRRGRSAPQSGVDVPSMDHLRELRAEISALSGTPFVNIADILQLPEDLRALRSERSALQPGIDVPSMDYIQEDLLAFRSGRSALQHGGDVPSIVKIQELQDHVSALREAPSVIPGTFCCFGRASAPCAVSGPPCNLESTYIHELRGQMSALRETPSVNPADALLLQEELRALRSGPIACLLGLMDKASNI